MNTRISIVGLGWLGLPLAHSLNTNGFQIQGTYSNPKRFAECEALPFPCKRIHFSEHQIEGDWDELINQTDILIINIPPKRNQSGEIRYTNFIQHIINQTPSNISVVFISSTSVYGNLDIKITEDIEPQPVTLSGQALLKSEILLKTHFKDQLTILRCSGLIGPNRHPGRFLAGRLDVSNPNGLVNMVHQKDCIQIITKVIKQHALGYTLNLCSDQHPTRHVFYTETAELLQLPKPQFNSDSSISIKYIDNTKSKELLNHTYLTLEEALKLC